MFGAIPIQYLLDAYGPYQLELPIHTPKFILKKEYCVEVPDEFICEQSAEGISYSSLGHVDHPSFTRLRKHLATKGLIHMETGWKNGDRVLNPFYINDILFEEGQKFLCAIALHYKLFRK